MFSFSVRSFFVITALSFSFSVRSSISKYWSTLSTQFAADSPSNTGSLIFLISGVRSVVVLLGFVTVWLDSSLAVIPPSMSLGFSFDTGVSTCEPSSQFFFPPAIIAISAFICCLISLTPSSRVPIFEISLWIASTSRTRLSVLSSVFGSFFLGGILFFLVETLL
ncbi:unnamed protein product [Cochlearia groenlandica]